MLSVNVPAGKNGKGTEQDYVQPGSVGGVLAATNPDLRSGCRGQLETTTSPASSVSF